jgi:hypothetical protein
MLPLRFDAKQAQTGVRTAGKQIKQKWGRPVTYANPSSRKGILHKGATTSGSLAPMIRRPETSGGSGRV